MVDEQFTKNRILKEAWERLSQHGYSNVIIDELAADLGISKKTIYKFFPTKKDLIRNVVVGTFMQLSGQITGLFQDNQLEYTEKLKKLFETVGVLASKIGPTFMDLQKNAPEIVAELIELRQNLIITNFRNLIEEGIVQGIVRSDIKPDIAMLILINTVNSVAVPKVLIEIPYSIKEVFETVIKVIFNGILNEGHKI